SFTTGPATARSGSAGKNFSAPPPDFAGKPVAPKTNPPKPNAHRYNAHEHNDPVVLNTRTNHPPQGGFLPIGICSGLAITIPGFRRQRKRLFPGKSVDP